MRPEAADAGGVARTHTAGAPRRTSTHDGGTASSWHNRGRAPPPGLQRSQGRAPAAAFCSSSDDPAAATDPPHSHKYTHTYSHLPTYLHTHTRRSTSSPPCGTASSRPSSCWACTRRSPARLSPSSSSSADLISDLDLDLDRIWLHRAAARVVGGAQRRRQARAPTSYRSQSLHARLQCLRLAVQVSSLSFAAVPPDVLLRIYVVL